MDNDENKEMNKEEEEAWSCDSPRHRVSPQCTEVSSE